MLVGIDGKTLLGIFVLPAVVFALIYFPIVTQLSRGLLSPYAKAEVKRRLYAATIDGLMVVTSCFLYWNLNVVLYLAAGGAYLLFRDAIKGQSIGKFLLGLVVISLETGRPSSLTGSVRRNALLLLPEQMSSPFSSRRAPSYEIPKVSDWETAWRRHKLWKAGEPRTSSSRFRTGLWALVLSWAAK
jgi:uncharacterized RDD family membrane protein YckC